MDHQLLPVCIASFLLLNIIMIVLYRLYRLEYFHRLRVLCNLTTQNLVQETE